MDIKKIKRGERLQLVLTDLGVGECIRVPYRFYSENTIRATVSQLKADKSVEYDINARSNIAAVLTRTA